MIIVNIETIAGFIMVKIKAERCCLLSKIN